MSWPNVAGEGRQTIEICAAAPDRFALDLEVAVNREELNDRVLAFRRVDGPGQLPGCHVLYLSTEFAAYRALLAGATRLPVLTVSDDPGFADSGGIVVLRVIDGRVLFDVNDEAARRVGLRISSNLLRLALSRRPGTQ